MIRTVVIGLLCVAYVTSLTTTKAPHHHHTGTHHAHSGPTREPAEHENFRFIYESHSHMMLVATGKKCYIFSLSDSERGAIHTDAGIRAVELKLLSTLSTASVTEVTKDQLSAQVAHSCGHVDHYYKETIV
ncbi:uncharacterized protein LOC123523571 [Mercenaria mercenaria]|uniref:uncharacterized protein LOC123523571 n=1 Tax=Mercenaria mercenaria TaxID=6596 RepID=UPI001E1D7BC9|nr:uncharacterized protein LOC123523571 [Mercenaria mercenaria]